MSDDWFTWHLAPDGNLEDGCHPEEAAALKDYLHSTTVTAEVTAHNITLPVTKEPETARKGQSSDNLYRLWTLILDGLTDLPEHRLKIIQLLKAIQHLPVSSPKERGAPKKQIQWANLPKFGSLWADLKVSPSWRREIHKWTPEQRENVRQDYLNEITIDTQLVVADISGVSLSWGLGCICDALERSDAVSDFEVPATSIWLETAGDKIFKASDDEVTEYLRERDLWKQGGEERKQRWNFWMGRLQSMAESEALSLETREAVKKAVGAMKTVAK